MAKEKLHLVDAKTEYYISLDEVLFCSASGNYTDIYLVNHTKYPTIRIQLGQLWTKIKELGKMVEHHLERIGRSYIINVKYIQYVNPKRGKLTLHTNKDVELEIPKRAIERLMKFVGRKEDKRVVTVFANKRKLTVGRHQLNEDMTFEKGAKWADKNPYWIEEDMDVKDGEFSKASVKRVKKNKQLLLVEEFGEGALEIGEEHTFSKDYLKFPVMNALMSICLIKSIGISLNGEKISLNYYKETIDYILTKAHG